jgi:uncharacterized protein with LGFP repeats
MSIRRSFLHFSVLTLVLGLFLPVAPTAAATSQIDQRYASEAYLRTLLGTPKASETSVAGGKERSYKNGSLYWSSSTGVHYILNDLLVKYKSVGGPSAIGFPVNDETESWASNHSHVASSVDTQKGTVIWVFGMGWGPEPPHYLPSVMYDKYWKIDGYYNGVPLSDGVAVGKNGTLAELSSGQIYHSTATGARYVTWPISDKHLEKGGANAYLGLPTSEMNRTSTGDGFVQSFQGGTIYSKDGSEAHELHGGIRTKFNSEGGLASLGYPKSDELWTSYGRKQYFEHGQIQWRSAGNMTSVIRS